MALHTTSDLLRLLAADGAPFADVAAAVVARFGADAASRAWLARTLVTLLRDGLLYTEAEKLNAAYLLRFAAPDVPCAREALLHLSLPDSGEPPAVRAWAGSLATAPPPTWQPHPHEPPPAPPGAAALMHRQSPQQLLAEASAVLDSQVQFCGLQLGQPPPMPPWQAAVAAAASDAAELQHQQQALQAPQPPQQLATPASPQAAQQQPQQERQLESLRALLRQAAQAPLVPATQQRLIDALRGDLGAELTAPLAREVDGTSAAAGEADSSTLQPQHMRGLVEHNALVAAELLVALAERHPEAAPLFGAAVAELPVSAQSMEVMSAVVARAELADWVLTAFLSNCMQDTNACQDAGRQSRQVRLLCACVALVLQRQPGALAESLPELLAFCIQQSRYKQASELYRQLRDLG